MKLYLPYRLSLIPFTFWELLKAAPPQATISANNTISNAASLTADESLTGKLVVITGACSVAGRAAALKFAKSNADLILISPDESSLYKVQAECRLLGANVSTFLIDDKDIASNANIINKVKTCSNRIDLWINNAAPRLE